MQHGRDAGNVAEVDELVEEEEENSDEEPLRPPANLLQQARDILGRAVTRTELMKAWDESGKHTTVDTKTQATLERLLFANNAEEPVNNHVVERREQDRLASPPAAASPSRKHAKAKNEVIDLDDEASDDEQTRKAKKGKKRAYPREDVVNRQQATKKRRADVIDLDDSDEEVQMVREAMRRSMEPEVARTREGSSRDIGDAARPSVAASSSNSTGSDDPVLVDNTRRKASTPPTPALGKEEPPSPLVQVLAMVPDVDPDFAETLIQKFKDQPNCVEHVIDSLFSDNSYPKYKPRAGSSAPDKGKRKATGEEEMEAKEKMYMDIKTRANPKPIYCEASFAYLEMEPAFLLVPKPHIRKVQQIHHHFYAPTHKQLSDEVAMANPPFTRLQNPRKNKGKGMQVDCPEFEEERDWVQAKIERERLAKAAQLAEEAQEKAEEEAGQTFECGCCFGDYVFSKAIQCPEGHLFCRDCARKNAENALGNRQTELQCMDQDGCTIAFSAAECAKFLKPNQILLLEKLVTEKAIDAAGLSGLAKCPYCPWACVVENPDERLLRCENEECTKVSCLKCQKADHLPKTCEEYAEDLKTNTIHKVEEAMTEALIRKCPKCQQTYIKEYGCNKMICTNENCRAMSCYICCQLITGYDHFKNQGLPNGGANKTSNCILWDYNEGTNEYERVENARKAAMAEIKAVGDADAKVSDEDLAKLAVERPANPGMRLHPGQVVGRPYIDGLLAAPGVAGVPAAANAMAGFNPYVDAYQQQVAQARVAQLAQMQAMQARIAAAQGAAAAMYPHPPHPIPARPIRAPKKRQKRR